MQISDVKYTKATKPIRYHLNQLVEPPAKPPSGSASFLLQNPSCNCVMPILTAVASGMPAKLSLVDVG